MAQRQGDESDQLKVFQQIVCAHLQNRDSARQLKAAEGNGLGEYRGTTMEANKRDWNSVGKSSKKSQVRQTDQVWYHDDMDESSLARAIHASTSPLLVKQW